MTDTADQGFSPELARRRLNWLDDRRRVLLLVEEGHSDEEIRSRAGISDRLIGRAINNARRSPDTLTTSPAEVIDQFIVGDIDRRALIDRLSTMPYTFNKLHGYDGFERGTWSDVRAAHHAGIIDDEAVQEVIRRGHVHGDWNPFKQRTAS